MLRSVSWSHLSWAYILTQANILLKSDEIESREQWYLLNEFGRSFSDDKNTLKYFDHMHQNWKPFVTRVRAGEKMKSNDPDVEQTASDWHEEVRDISLKMSVNTKERVTVGLNREQRKNPSKLMQDTVSGIVKDGIMTAILIVPDTVSPIEISVDIGRAMVTCCMSTNCPNNPRAITRINWITKQIPELKDETRVFIEAKWPGRSPRTQKTLAEVRSDPKVLFGDNQNLLPTGFRVIRVADLGSRISSSKKFIIELEQLIYSFYFEVGENLTNWVKPPPKILPQNTEDELPTDG